MNYNALASLLQRQDESRLAQLRLESTKYDHEKLAIIAAAVTSKQITRRQGKALVEAMYPSESGPSRTKPKPHREVAWKTTLRKTIAGSPVVVRKAVSA